MRRTLGIILFSIIEVAGLAGWLVLADQGGGLIVVGIFVLAIGLILEHIVTDNVLHNRPFFNLSSLPIQQIVGFSLLETGIWVSWLLRWGVHPALATVFLAFALLVEHTVSKNVHERRVFLDKIIDVAVIPHTIVETVSCDVWLVLARSAHPILAVVSLLVGSLVEHTIAVSRTKPGSNQGDRTPL